MNSNIYSLVLLIFSSVLISCGQVSSEDVSPEIIRTNYSASYSEGSNKLYLKGSFTIANATTYVDLDGLSKLKINGAWATRESNIFGQIFYVRDQVSSGNPSMSLHNFEYTDSKGGIYYNSIRIPSKTSFNAPTELGPEEELRVNLEVQDVSDGAENIKVTISGKIADNSNSCVTKYLGGGLATGVVHFDENDLIAFRGQTITLSVCRKLFSSVTDHPGKGGYLRSNYCATKASILLK